MYLLVHLSFHQSLYMYILPYSIPLPLPSFFLSSLSPSCVAGPLPSSCLSIHFSVHPFFLPSLLHSITPASMFSFLPFSFPPGWTLPNQPSDCLFIHPLFKRSVYPPNCLSSQPSIHSQVCSFFFIPPSFSLSFFLVFFTLLTPHSTQLHTGTSKLFSHPDKKNWGCPAVD